MGVRAFESSWARVREGLCLVISVMLACRNDKRTLAGDWRGTSR